MEVFMRKVHLRMREEYKYKIIKNLVDNNGNKKNAAVKLNCSIRTIDRLIKRYKEFGKTGFIHGNRGKLPSNTFTSEVKRSIIDKYINEYKDTNFTHFSEIIKEELAISVSDTTINNWLREQMIISPKARRKTKKNMKKLLKNKLNLVKSEKIKNQIKEDISMIDSKDAHPTRPRSKYMGEMIQMDASSFFWIKDEIWHLHLAVDDATGEVVGAYFDTQETLHGYYNVFYQILNNYGIPAMFYTDRRTVFEYKRKNTAFDEEDTFTQFSYACHQLGVEIKTTSVAQAKGRVERLNQTFQSRLPVELRRAHITNIDAANEFLKSYIKKFNAQFALRLNTTQNVFELQPEKEKLNTILSVISLRVVDKGHCIKYKNKQYKVVTSNNERQFPKQGSTAMVIDAFDNNLYANILDQLFILEELDSHERYSILFDDKPKIDVVKKKYIPPLTHPWKQASYNAYVAKQKHRMNDAYI